MLRPAFACLLLAAVTALAPAARAQEPGLPGGQARRDRDAPVFLRFVNAPPEGVPRRGPPTLGLSFGGRTVRAVMDTGSTGVVVAASTIPNIEALPVLGPGELTYTSSGRVMRGIYVEVPVTLRGKRGRRITTRPIPVLAVQRIECLASARNCRPQDNPRRVAMLGVGVGREGDRQSTGTPEKNPFLNLPAMGRGEEPGALLRGYVITRDGVTIGLRREQEEGFSRIKLKRNAAGTDWEGAPACISVNGQGPACGHLLMDTGLATMFLTVPRAQTEGASVERGRTRLLADGATVTVRLGESEDAPSYGFTVGDRANPLAPNRVILVGGETTPPFVNTTVRLLNGFDYRYNAEDGTVGFRRRM